MPSVIWVGSKYIKYLAPDLELRRYHAQGAPKYTSCSRELLTHIPVVVVPQIRLLLKNTIGHDAHLGDQFHSDPDRLRNEVIALTVTGQLSDMFEEMALPIIKHKVREWWRTYQSERRYHHLHSHNPAAKLSGEDPHLKSVRSQAYFEAYNVQDDISEMVIQFGYLALFSPVWPLVSVGFLVNNWVELRSDFLKLCTQHQRPHPIRTEGIGPWVAALDVLTWLGSISAAAIVDMFGNEGQQVGYTTWMRLLVTVFLSEHLYLLFRVGVGSLLRRIGSEQVRKERAAAFAFRKKYLDELEVQSKVRETLYGGRQTQGTLYEGSDEDVLWQTGKEVASSEEVGLALIQDLKSEKESAGSKED